MNKFKGKRDLGLLIVLLTGIIIIYQQYEMTRKPNKIVFISKSTQKEYIFWETIRMGAQLAAKEEGIMLEYTGPLEEKDVEVQMEILGEQIEQGSDIILLAAADSERLIDLVKEAKKKGITILTIDSTVKEPTYIVATDNIEAASTLTRYLVDELGGEGEVIMLNFVQGTSTAEEREEGYELEMAKHPSMTKLPTMYTEGTTESAYRQTKEIIERYPNIKAIVGGNQYTTEGICLAVQEMGKNNKIKVVGFDSSSVIVEALEKRALDAIIVQKPFNMGYIGVKTAIEVFNNKKIDFRIDTGYKLITPESLYTTENQKLLYPIIE